MKNVSYGFSVFIIIIFINIFIIIIIIFALISSKDLES